MLFALRTKTSDVLERLLKDYIEPSNIFMNMIHNMIFINKKITRIDDIIIFEQDSLFQLFGKFAMLPSIVLFILGMILSYPFLMTTGALMIIISMSMLSRYLIMISIIIKLKISKHKESIRQVSDGFLISKLLMERHNGTARSV